MGRTLINQEDDGPAAWLGEQRRLAYAYGAAYVYSWLAGGLGQPIREARETIELRDGAFLRTVMVTIKTPSERQFREGGAADHALLGRFYVPLFMAQRGRLNSFDVSGENGSGARLLHRSDAERLARLVLALAWERAFSNGLSPHGKRVDLRRQVLDVPMAPAADATRLAASLLDEFLAKLPRETLVDIHAFEYLKLLIGFFASTTIVWAEVRGIPGETFVLNYSYEWPLTLSTLSEQNRFEVRQVALRERGGLRSRLMLLELWLIAIDKASRQQPDALEFIRSATGKLPGTMVIPVGMAHLAESYHLHLRVPDGSYVYSQELLVLRKISGEGPAEVVPLREEFAHELAEGAEYQGEEVSGGTSVHLRTYRIPAKRARYVYARIELKERPSGLSDLTLTVGRLTLALNTFLAVSFLLLLQLSESAVDVVALFLAVATFARASLGRHHDVESRSAETIFPSRSGIFDALLVMNSAVLLLAIAVREAGHGPGWRIYLVFWIPVMLTAVLNAWLVAVLARRHRTAVRDYRKARHGLP